MRVPQLWMWVPQVQPSRAGEQRLAYVQGLIDESMGLITAQDIVNLYQHTQGFFRTGHGSGSMNYNKYTILDTCIIIFLIQYSWFGLFCYGYSLLSVICMVFVVLRNWYVIKWEVLKLICTILKCSWNYLKLTWIIWNSFGNSWNWPELSEIHLDISEIVLKKV